MGGEPVYRVIANCEDEYAVWPIDKTVPPAWRAMPVTGTREECLTYIRLLDQGSSQMVRGVVERGTTRP